MISGTSDNTNVRGIVSHVRKIAVLRANAMGDFIVTLPALHALKAAYPAAEITLLGRDWHRDLLAGRPGPLDRVIALPRLAGITAGVLDPEDDAKISGIVAFLKGERFDLALQLHGGGRYTNPFVRALGPRVSAGARAPDAISLDRWIPHDRWQHEVARGLEIVALVGAMPVSLEPRLSLTEADLREANSILEEGSGPFVAIHPGGTNPERWWPANRFAALAHTLYSEGYTVVVVGTEDERMRAERVIHGLQDRALNLCGRLSVGGLAGVLSRCRIMVANDSGPLHIAGAVGTPTVGIYSAFNMLTFGPLTRERHRPVISWRREPGPAESGEEDAAASFLTDITVDDVLKRVQEVERWSRILPRALDPIASGMPAG